MDRLLGTTAALRRRRYWRALWVVTTLGALAAGITAPGEWGYP